MIYEILGIQILGVMFGLMMIYVSFMHSKRKEFTGKETLFWMSVWIGFIVITIYPRAIDVLAKDILNMSRTMDFLIITGFIILTGLLFHVYGVSRKTQKKLESVVRSVALARPRKK